MLWLVPSDAQRRFIVSTRALGFLLAGSLLLTGPLVAAIGCERCRGIRRHQAQRAAHSEDFRQPEWTSTQATKAVPLGSNALQVLQDTIMVMYKTYPELGAFITSLCGIDAPEGKVWTFTVDDKWSNLGIGKVTLERDTVIEWAMR